MILRKGLYYLFYIPSLFIASVFVITLGQLMPKRWCLSIATLWNLFASRILYTVFIGNKVELIGKENIPKAPFVAVSNHQSEWETLYFCYLLNPIVSILKRELLRIPFFGWALWGSGHIGIDRGNARGSIKTIETQGAKRLEKGINVLVFPEGTRVPYGDYRRFTRTGVKLAIDAGVPLLPIAHSAHNCWSPGGKFSKGKIQVWIGEPIDTKNKDSKELTDEVESWIRQKADLPTEKPQPHDS
ncbi:MAG: 1-acyl-sn-glycerol-3-phosphate acyltransferase [Porticoccaceae bacterium]|jgi:1-acyl-sn-glycerol-3-phosphate acyltransferase|nr:1-acyl-sn-glycerol-3-phosphate acyltransferase [Porticoccaceae bacterium]